MKEHTERKPLSGICPPSADHKDDRGVRGGRRGGQHDQLEGRSGQLHPQAAVGAPLARRAAHGLPGRARGVHSQGQTHFEVSLLVWVSSDGTRRKDIRFNLLLQLESITVKR